MNNDCPYADGVPDKANESFAAEKQRTAKWLATSKTLDKNGAIVSSLRLGMLATILSQTDASERSLELQRRIEDLSNADLAATLRRAEEIDQEGGRLRITTEGEFLKISSELMDFSYSYASDKRLDVKFVSNLSLIAWVEALRLSAVQRQEEPPPSARRMVDLASAVAAEPESHDEWRAHLQELAATGNQRDVFWFLIGIVYASLHSRIIWLLRQAAAPGVKALCWGLRSDKRTWALLSVLLLWFGINTAEDTGVGAAILGVLAAFGGLAWLVAWLRNRFDAHPPDKAAPPGPGD